MGKCPPSLPISYSLDHVTEKMLEKSINFIPLWKRMWHHNGSLWCTPVFWPPSFLLLRILSCKQITARHPCISTLPNLNRHLRHIHSWSGIKFSFYPHPFISVHQNGAFYSVVHFEELVIYNVYFVQVSLHHNFAYLKRLYESPK